MKRKLYLAAVAAVALASCNEPVALEPENVSELVEIDLSLRCGETKSEGTLEENKITNVQVYVFDDGNVIEAYHCEQYKRETLSSATTTVKCTPGNKRIVALVNAPEMPDVQSYEDLCGRTSYYSDNDTASLQMTGEVSKKIEGATEITIPVSRIAAKVTIASITNAMEVDYYKGLSFSITDIYMLNVAGSTGYLEDKAPELWYNKMKKEDNGPLCFMLERNNSIYITVKNPETMTFTQQQEHAYYAYPNATETDSSDPVWGPRYTRMVLQARLGDQVCYYPVSIPNVERNTAYEVHLTVTRPGSPSPDIPVDVKTASVTVNVVDWTDAPKINETI